MDKVILHADLNNFYASVACLASPALREVPLAVCGDPTLRHGIVLAKNMPAKTLGIYTGQTLTDARKLCPNLMTMQPDFHQVLRLSDEVRGIMSRYTSHVQPFGIDEAWLDISGPGVSISTGERVANHLRHTIREETGLTASIGISDNRIFAKLGSDLKKPDAVSVVCKENRKTVLDPLSVNDLLFVGRATQRKLNDIGIYTIGHLADIDPQILKGLLGKNGLMLSCFARGDDTSPVMAAVHQQTVKSVGNSVTTAHDVCDYQHARITLYGLCESIASRLRKHQLVGRVVQISMRDTALDTIQRQCTLPFATDCSYDIFAYAFDLLTRYWGEKYPLRSLGVCVSQLSPADELLQLSFLPEDARRQRNATLDRTVDQIRDRYGHFSIQRAVMLYDRALGKINPEEEHIIHPVAFLK
ncbi:MAG: DNA polymerase IV [Clostridiales bacterium]|nr:DNA polymerase IV [Clostridiales bacterium]